MRGFVCDYPDCKEKAEYAIHLHQLGWFGRIGLWDSYKKTLDRFHLCPRHAEEYEKVLFGIDNLKRLSRLGETTK